MSREIKFRYWDSFLNIMSYSDHWIWEEFKDVIDQTIEDRTLMQYTGLEDRKGNPIYEGDIVYIAGVGNCEVEWGDNFGGWVFSNHSGSEDYQGVLEDLERIIGNIYENPELL